MKKPRNTVELIAVRCVCGKAVIRATVTKLSVGVMSANVEDQITPCPECGSKDIKAAHAAQAAAKKP